MGMLDAEDVCDVTSAFLGREADIFWILGMNFWKFPTPKSSASPTVASGAGGSVRYDIRICWPRNRGVLDLEGNFHLENLRSLNPQSFPAESPAVAPGEKFSVPAALGATRSLLCYSEGLMQPGFCELGLK